MQNCFKKKSGGKEIASTCRHHDSHQFKIENLPSEERAAANPWVVPAMVELFPLEGQLLMFPHLYQNPISQKPTYEAFLSPLPSLRPHEGCGVVPTLFHGNQTMRFGLVQF